MPYQIEDKLVIGIASSALFDLAESDRIFREKGRDKYREYQREHENDTLEKGVAFAFIRRMLSLNDGFPDIEPVEVVLLSRNDPDTGLRVMNSIRAHGLDITRSVFMSGKSPFEYIPAFNCSLFLSANPKDVKQAVDAGYPAGTVLEFSGEDDPDDKELRIAFDFDGVIADDESETVYQESGDIEKFQEFEADREDVPLGPGPLQAFFKRLSMFQQMEAERATEDLSYQPVLRTAIITARSAPAHKRLINTLKEWGVSADETLFTGGIQKGRFLEVFRPHLFCDDQMKHLLPSASNTPSVHIPFGITNHYCPVKYCEIAVVFDRFRDGRLKRSNCVSEVPVKWGFSRIA